MGLENNSISIPFHWSGGGWAVTIVTLIVLAGAGFYIASLNWPTVMLWLKYLLTIILLTTVIGGVGYMPIRLHILLFVILLTGCSEQSKTTSLTSDLDYSSAAMWYAHTENTRAEVDVFYVTPTCIWDWTDSTGEVHHQMDVANQMQRTAVDGSNALANALFSKSCRFYSPYYRQISMESWMQPKEEIEQRYKLAHKDVVKAFEYYMSHYNQGRPFILAGHSQGGKAVLELLKHTVSKQQYKQMVAAYMFGSEVLQSDLDNYKILKPAQDSLDCGVVVCYNSVSQPQAVSPLFKDNVVCINPINWRTDATYAAATENLGSVFFREDGGSDTLFYQVGAKIEPTIQTLLMDGLDDEHYFIPLIAKSFPKGNYHVQEINLYFLNLQKNIEQRIRAFKQYAPNKSTYAYKIKFK